MVASRPKARGGTDNPQLRGHVTAFIPAVSQKSTELGNPSMLSYEYGGLGSGI